MDDVIENPARHSGAIAISLNGAMQDAEPSAGRP